MVIINLSIFRSAKLLGAISERSLIGPRWTIYCLRLSDLQTAVAADRFE